MPAVNACAGPFGAFYDFYIERPALMRALGKALWGIDASILYKSIESLDIPNGTTVIDNPCGGGVAFRALNPEDDVRYIAGDLCPTMVSRARRRAERRLLDQVELVQSDLTSLPFESGTALCYSGLHMLMEPAAAIREIARCLKPGGQLVGTSFFDGVARRARLLFAIGAKRGHAPIPSRSQIGDGLESAGLIDIEFGPQPGFAEFRARRPNLLIQ